MEGGFDKGIEPSKSAVGPRLSPPGSGENNENDSSQYQMIPKFQNQNKMVTKSPTPKAPSKKILGERNVNSTISDAQNHEMISRDVKEGRQDLVLGESKQDSSWIVSSYSYTSQPGEEVNAIISDDSLPKGYDPLTNYLSPRPKYLRFNPNRRAEILHRLESEGVDLNRFAGCKEDSDEEKSLVNDVEGSSSPSANEGSVKPETDENAEKVTEIIGDECEEEEEEELKEERVWCLSGVLKHVLMSIACLLSLSYICRMNSPTLSPAQQTPWNFSDGYLMIQKQTLEVMSVKMYDASSLGVELKVESNYGVAEEVKFDEGYAGRDSGGKVEAIEEVLEGHDDERVGSDNDNTEEKIDDENEDEDLTAGEIEFKNENFEQLVGPKTDEIVDIVGVGETEYESEGVGQSMDAITYEIEDVATVDALENIEEDSNQLKEFELSKDDGTLQEELKQQNNGLESSSELLGLADNRDEMQKLGWSISAVVGVFVGSLLLAAASVIYSSKKAKINAKASKPVVKKKPQKENVVTTAPPLERKVEFLARQSLHSAVEAPRELNHRIHAPAVELIGEIVVGERRRVKNSGTKFQMTEFKESIETYLPRPQPVSTPIRAGMFEYSTNPSLHGRFTTTEKNHLKKEEGQSGEAAVPTPLRRSSRLRSRIGSMSP